MFYFNPNEKDIMKTEVIMKRELFGSAISQKSTNEFFSATDLVRAANKLRRDVDLPLFNMAIWLSSESTKSFMAELDKKYGQCIIKSRGRTAQTWMHPLLFIDMALAISPILKIEVYSWLYDHLIKNRNDSGDNYKLMCGALYERHKNKRSFPDYISKVALAIKHACHVTDWETANEQQLEKRKAIQYDITAFTSVMDNVDEAVKLGIRRNCE